MHNLKWFGRQQSRTSTLLFEVGVIWIFGLFLALIPRTLFRCSHFGSLLPPQRHPPPPFDLHPHAVACYRRKARFHACNTTETQTRSWWEGGLAHQRAWLETSQEVHAGYSSSRWCLWNSFHSAQKNEFGLWLLKPSTERNMAISERESMSHGWMMSHISLSYAQWKKQEHEEWTENETGTGVEPAFSSGVSKHFFGKSKPHFRSHDSLAFRRQKQKSQKSRISLI